MNSPFSIVQAMPQAVQGAASTASVFTVAATYLEQIRGPVATIAAILGACWLVMQMVNMAWNWVDRIKKRKR